MKMILKKNQVIISVIAIMLIAAGYMNYTANNKQTLQTAALKDSEKYGEETNYETHNSKRNL